MSRRRTFSLLVLIFVFGLSLKIYYQEKPRSFKFTPSSDVKSLRNVLAGGEYRPKQWTSNETTAIIVPFRDREGQIQTFIEHIHSFLQKQNLHYMVFLVEMAQQSIYNKGILANVGFSVAKEFHNFSCFVFNDVDLLPMNEELRYTCNGSIYHYCVEHSKYNYRLPYYDNFGGVVAFPGNLYEKVNGFSNAYFGWGGEDDDLLERVWAAKLDFKRPPGLLGRYYHLNHSRDQGNRVNPDRHGYLCASSARYIKDGLNSLKYKELERVIRPLYTWIYVSVNETEVMASIPEPGLCLESVLTYTLPVVLIAVVALYLTFKYTLIKACPRKCFAR